jgi:hypothetical protein
MINRPSNVKVTDRSVHVRGDVHGSIGTGDHIHIEQPADPPSPTPTPERAAGTPARVGIVVALIGAAAAIIAALIAHLK